jgi:hypothetical protein
MSRTIHLSSGEVKRDCRLEVWDDLSAPRKAYRLFWVVPGETTGTPAHGYATENGSFPTIAAAKRKGLTQFGEEAVRT